MVLQKPVRIIMGLCLVQMFTVNMPAIAGGESAVAKSEKAISKCAGCHATGKTGNSLHQYAPPFRELALRWPPESIAEALAEGIVTGHPDMPEFALPPSEIEEIISRLRTLLRESRRK